MAIEFIAQNLVDRNPFDSRLVRPQADIVAKADSIKQHGLLQEPKGRRVGERVQLAYGWTRFEGWKIAKPNEPFPVNVVELTDEQMSLHSFEENDKQNALTQIEKARWLAKHMAHFGVTQAALAREIDKDGSTVSNLLRLLTLPEAIQDMMLGVGNHAVGNHASVLPERLARQLIPLAKAHPKQAIELANKTWRKPEAEREEIFNDELAQLFWDKKIVARMRGNASFAPDWKPSQLPLSDGLEPKIATACIGCAFRIKHDGNEYCLRVRCLEAKEGTWQQVEAERVAAKLKVQNARVIANSVTPIAIQYGSESELQAMLDTHDPALRVAPIKASASEAGQDRTTRERVLGSESVMLAAATPGDAARIQKSVRAEMKRADANGPRSAAQRADAARAQKEQAARREAHDILKTAAPQLALALFPLTLRDVVLDDICGHYSYHYRDGHDKAVVAYRANKRETLALCFLYKKFRVERFGMVDVKKVQKELGELAKVVGVELNAKADKTTSAAKARGNAKAKTSKKAKSKKGAR